MITIPIISPISSTIAEKIKSSVTYGIVFGLPKNKPLPNHPPLLNANKDCAI